MDLKINGKKALVMGASAGLGLGIAKALVEEGVNVVISSRSEENLKKAQKLSYAQNYIVSDFTQKNAALDLFKKMETLVGAPDILIVNTGGPKKGAFMDVSATDWERDFQNLWLSTVDIIQASLPQMKKNQWGRILVVTSVAAKEPLPNMAVSNGLRAGLLGLMKSLSTEVASFGITVNCLLPGYTDTERLRELGISYDQISKSIPAGRIGSVEDFSKVSTFLCSHWANYLTGQMISIDGGVLRGI